MAKRAMAEFRAPMTPGHNFAALELFADFFVEMLFAIGVLVDDLAVVEDGFDFLGSGLGAESECCQRSAAGVAGESPAREKPRAERGAGVAGDWLHVDMLVAAAQLEGADEKDIEKDPPGEAERIGSGGFAEVACKLNDK